MRIDRRLRVIARRHDERRTCPYCRGPFSGRLPDCRSPACGVQRPTKLARLRFQLLLLARRLSQRSDLLPMNGRPPRDRFDDRADPAAKTSSVDKSKTRRTSVTSVPPAARLKRSGSNRPAAISKIWLDSGTPGNVTVSGFDAVAPASGATHCEPGANHSGSTMRARSLCKIVPDHESVGCFRCWPPSARPRPKARRHQVPN